jgi:hypothetical protein
MFRGQTSPPLYLLRLPCLTSPPHTLGPARRHPAAADREAGAQRFESPTPSDLAPPLAERAKAAVAGADQAAKEGVAAALHGGAGLLGRIKVGRRAG